MLAAMDLMVIHTGSFFYCEFVQIMGIRVMYFIFELWILFCYIFLVLFYSYALCLYLVVSVGLLFFTI